MRVTLWSMDRATSSKNLPTKSAVLWLWKNPLLCIFVITPRFKFNTPLLLPLGLRHSLKIAFASTLPIALGFAIKNWLPRRLDSKQILVDIINDIGPYCYAIPTLDKERDVKKLNAATERVDSTSVAVVPGTGLGTGTLNSMGRQEIFVPSELQHAPIPASTSHQKAIVDFLETNNPEQGPLTTEDLCSYGRGLNNLYTANRALAHVANDQGAITGTEIVARSSTDPICSQTVDDFCALLGAFSAQLALTSVSRGGAYLFGAHEKLGANFRADQFMGGVAACVKGKPGISELIASIPLYLVTAQTPAFRGLQRAAQQLRL